MKDSLVHDWQKEHRDELDKSLQVLITIRDNEEGNDKNRIDAAVAIARLLGAATDSRVKKDVALLEKPGLKPSAKSEIDKYLDAL